MRIFARFGLALIAVSLSQCVSPPKSVGDGVYWSQTLQEYLVIQDQQFRSYQWTLFSCSPTISGLLPAAGTLQSKLGQLHLQASTDHALQLSRISDGLPLTFDKVAELPASCVTPPVATAMTQWIAFQQTLQAFGHRFADSTRQQLQQQVAAIDQVVDDTEYSELVLFQVLRQALAELGDGHAFLYSRELQQYWTALQTPAPPTIAGQAYCNGAITLRKQGRDVWLHVQRLLQLEERAVYSSAPPACLMQVAHDLAAIATPERWRLQVDLRNNVGGSLSYAAELLNMLSRNGHPPLAIINGLTIRSDTAYPQRPAFAELSVWINRSTASAAEHLALGLKHQGFQVWGETSAGSFSPAIVKTLPNGWFFGFSMYQQIEDGLGQPVPEGVGIHADCPSSAPQARIKCYPAPPDTAVR